MSDSDISASFDFRSGFKKALRDKSGRLFSWKNLKPVLTDPSLWFLFFSNVITVYVASVEGWGLLELMWTFWFQSIIIGFYNFLRILSLKSFSTDELKLNGEHTKPNIQTKRAAAFFFLVHFGFFHFVYLGFLGGLTKLGGVVAGTGELRGFALPNFNTIILPAFIFFLNHSYSFLFNRPRDTEKQSLRALMFYPYVRILPMHLSIILTPFFSSVRFFLGLKVFADSVMHIVEHTILRKNQE